MREELMLGKVLLLISFITIISTTGAVAKNNINSLITLAAKQEKLSAMLVSSYNNKNKTVLIANLKSIEAGQTTLKSSINDPEISNLLVYIDMCLTDLKILTKKPYSSSNAKAISELCTSVSEGNQYVARSLKG